jgi:hypothetical protein
MCTFVLSKASKLSTKSQRALRWRHQLVCIYLFVKWKEADANISGRVSGSICTFVLVTQSVFVLLYQERK